jgi:hypothetical protein
MSNEANSRVMIIIRQAKPNKAIGYIETILPSNQYIGKNVNKSNGSFAAIYVVDLPLILENELLSQIKKLKVPAESDPMYSGLKSDDNFIGSITVNTATLLPYIVLA